MTSYATYSRILKGELTKYYALLREAEELQVMIAEERMTLGSAKAVSFDREPGSGSGPTHDQQLLRMISRIDLYESRQTALVRSALRISKRLHLDTAITEKERQILKTVYDSGSYERAGMQLGYSKKQVYRLMHGIYETLSVYCMDDGE